MDEKLSFLEKSLPKAALKPMTPEAVDTVPQQYLTDGLIVIKDFPFRIGRESRVAMVNGRLEAVERPKLNDTKPNNDIYLIDRGHRLNISREHFQIEKNEDGYYLLDRGSASGTKIEGRNIGGNDMGGGTDLIDGDTIGVGAKNSPYIFQFVSFEKYSVVLK